MLIGSVGYGLAAAAFGGLALLMLTSWRGRLQGGLLVMAAGFTALWAAAAAFSPATPAHWHFVTALEVARNTAWLVFLARLSPAGQGLDGRRPQLLSLAPAAFVLVYGLATLFMARGPDNFAMLLKVLILTGLVTAISGLVLLEQAYRALRAAPRKQVLPLIVAVGGILAYDLFMYSHGLLFRALHQELWAARGYANLLAIPFLLLAARRNPAWSVDVFISRHVAFYTTSLMGIGAYLLVMAVAGYGLRIAGGEWGFVLQVVFFFGALVVLAWVLFSPSARAALRVFIAKHFYSNKYDYREEWLKLTQRLAEGAGTGAGTNPRPGAGTSPRPGASGKPSAGLAPVEPLPIRGLNALAELVGSDAAILWSAAGSNAAAGATDTAVSDVYQRSALAGNVGDPAVFPQELSATDPVVEFLAERHWTINLAQARHNPESHPGLALPDWCDRLGRNTLLVPLLNQDRLWGFVALLNPTRVGRLSYEDIDLLRVAGMQVAAVLAQAEADRLLTESRQFEAFNRFAAFIMHDLKNIIAQQSLVVRNATKYRDDPAFIDDALDTVANSVERMQRLLEQLKRGESRAQVERVDVSRLIAESVRKRTEREPVPTAELPDSTLRLRVDRERLAAVVGHLLTNAQDATPADGSVRIETSLEADGGLVIAVVDTGCGMEEEFIRERLFRPFDSTKGTKGMGIGAYQARQFVQALGGDVRIVSAPGEGTRFELLFPAAVVEQEGTETSAPVPPTQPKEASPGA